MTSDANGNDAIWHYLYRSNAVSDLDDDGVLKILQEARDRNAVFGITGCLHVEGGMFFQWIEGTKSELDKIIALIKRDPRHTEITDLSTGPIGQRRFAAFSMRVTDGDAGSLLDWFASQQVSTIDRGAYAGSVAAFLMAVD